MKTYFELAREGEYHYKTTFSKEWFYRTLEEFNLLFNTRKLLIDKLKAKMYYYFYTQDFITNKQVQKLIDSYDLKIGDEVVFYDKLNDSWAIGMLIDLDYTFDSNNLHIVLATVVHNNKYYTCINYEELR